jgi:hypothetical protein
VWQHWCLSSALVHGWVEPKKSRQGPWADTNLIVNPIELLLIRHRSGKIDALNAQQIRGGAGHSFFMRDLHDLPTSP